MWCKEAQQINLAHKGSILCISLALVHYRAAKVSNYRGPKEAGPQAAFSSQMCFVWHAQSF